MKIAISSPDGKVDTPFSPRFGRCAYFVFYDTETGAWEAVVNPALSASGGAGSLVVQFLYDQGVQAAISGKYGPNAYKALEAAGIKAFEAHSGTPQELVQKYQAGELKQISAATGPGRHH